MSRSPSRKRETPAGKNTSIPSTTGSMRRSTRAKQTSAGVFEESLQLKVEFISDDDIKTIIHFGMSLDSVITNTNSTKTKLKSVKKQCNRKEVEEDFGEENVESDDDDLNGDEASELCEKPTGLMDEDDIAGEKMCSFRTPTKKLGMLKKAAESASKAINNSGTPKGQRERPSKLTSTPTGKLTPRMKYLSETSRTPSRRNSSKKANATPSKNDKEKVAISKTPYQLRARYKKDIQTYTRQLEPSDSDFEDACSDDSYQTEKDSSPEQSEDESSSDSGKGSEAARPACRRSILQQFTTTGTPSTRKRGKDLNYVFAPDEYFQSVASKSTTSDHCLSRLRTPRLDSCSLRNLLNQCSVSRTHQQILAQRRADDISMFQRWMFALSQGFSVLAYGLGSKYQILQNFHRQMLSDSHVLVVNGFFPNITIKEIVEMVAKDLLGMRQVLPSPHSIIDWIESQRRMPRVFLIIHNLDAEMLRCEKSQRILARLASLEKVHLIASIDHINCPLLWDQGKLSKFNFMWEDTTSFLPYQEETSYETSLMVKNSGSLALSSLLNVYRSLPNNSRGVFRIILEKHLDEKNPKYTGMLFSELYGRCREEMFVTSDLALRTMLTEFLDHQMVKWRREGEILYIPTDVSVLKQFHKLIQES